MKRIIPVALVLSVLIGLVFLRLVYPAQWIERLTDLGLDTYQQLSPTQLTPALGGIDPIFVAIDEESLDEFGQWPWDRDTIGSALIALYEQGAAVVALDILFAEPDRSSPHRLGERFPVISAIPNFATDVVNDYGYHDYDEFLADVLSQSGITTTMSF